MELPKTLLEWLTMLGLLGAWVGLVAKYNERQQKSRLKTIHDRLQGDIDGVGARVNGLEVMVGQHETAIDVVEREQLIARGERQTILDKLSRVEAGIDKLAETYSRHNVKISEELNAIRVSLAKLETEVKLTNHKE